MEYSIDNDKLIGSVGHELGGRSTRIKVLAFINSNGDINRLTESEASELFPPKGCVFEPAFFRFHPFQENDIISFKAEENEIIQEGYDVFRVSKFFNIQRYGLKARKIKNFNTYNQTTDLSKVIIEGDYTDGEFYGITDKYIVGKLRKKGKALEPSLFNRINLWNLDDLNVLDLKSQILLHNKPSGQETTIDCMDDKKLFEWFRNKLKLIDIDYVNLMDKKAKWREELPLLLTKGQKDIYEVENIRLNRIKEAISYISLSFNDIKTFIEKSDQLRTIFKEAVDFHKNQFKSEYQNELDSFYIKKKEIKEDLKKELKNFEEDIEIQKELLSEEINILNIQKQEKEKELEIVNNNIEKQQNQIKLINQNKARILSDFSIINDVFNLRQPNTVFKHKQNLSFIMESIKVNDTNSKFNSCLDFTQNLKSQLKTHHLFPNYAKRMIDVISSVRSIFLKDIRLGIAFAEATNNANYIIQQVGPDWLHFKNLWDNGLEAIWESAHQNPNQLHFLFLEDLNLSSPECYARPLLDVISGIRKRIPLGNSPYPNNLRIMVTKLPSHDPEIGLPIYDLTFKNWSMLGYTTNIYNESSEIIKPVNGFLTTELLNSFRPDEYDLEETISSENSNNIVFDEYE